ncbi:MAG TPA: hypothetical protein VK698_39345 [Kofleriaceae bacterium]|nr:hypothetical protein [Kofleriaceae bacterium]
MGIRERRAAIKAYKAADKALEEKGQRDQAAGIDYETPEFLRLNRAVAEAEDNPHLPDRYRDPRDLHD